MSVFSFEGPELVDIDTPAPRDKEVGGTGMGRTARFPAGGDGTYFDAATLRKGAGDVGHRREMPLSLGRNMRPQAATILEEYSSPTTVPDGILSAFNGG